MFQFGETSFLLSKEAADHPPRIGIRFPPQHVREDFYSLLQESLSAEHFSSSLLIRTRRFFSKHAKRMRSFRAGVFDSIQGGLIISRRPTFVGRRVALASQFAACAR
jgi:hypothetical protein